MKPAIQSIDSFASWDAAFTYLCEAKNHFVLTAEYPDPEPEAHLKPRILVRGENRKVGYTHVPLNAGNGFLAEYCRLVSDNGLIGENERAIERFLRLFARRLKEEDDKDLANLVVNDIAELFAADGAALLKLNSSRTALGFLGVHSRRHDLPDKLKLLELPLGTGIAGWVVAEKRAVLVRDVPGDPRFNPAVDRETNWKTTDMLAAPILSGDELIGVVQVVNCDDRAFKESDLPVLTLVAAALAVFLEKAEMGLERMILAQEAGKAEIATSVLHNIGNVLNSVSVSCAVIEEILSKSKLPQLHLVNDLLQQYIEDLPRFFAEHQKGPLIAPFLQKAAETLQREQDTQRGEIRKILDKTNLMKDIIETQQTIAKIGSSGTQDLIQVIEEALRLQQQSMERHEIQVVRHFFAGKPIHAEKSKLVHVLINLFKNAAEAMRGNEPGTRVLTLETGEQEDGGMYLKIQDRGVGISAEHLERMFTHGFTTKQDGHGFGLHYCAQVLRDMKIAISVSSDGPGKGAEFLLTFPPVPKRLT